MVLEKKQVICILVNLVCMKMIMSFSRIIVQTTGNAAWLNIIYVTLVSLLIFYIVTKCYSSDYGNFLTAAEKIGGKWLRRITGIVFALFFIMNISFTVRSYPETVKTVLLTETRMGIIVMMYMITAAIGAYLGIESNARIQAIFMPVAGVILVGFFLLSIPYWEINNIMPILGNGALPLFRKGIMFVSIFSDIFVLNFLMPYMKTKRDIKNSGFSSIIISGIVLFFLMGTYNMIYPYPVSADFILPIYQISRIVKFGNFFQRWEAFFQFIWSIGMYLYTSLYIAVIAKVIADAFDLKFSKPLVFPVAVITASAAFMINIKNSLLIMQARVYTVTLIIFCVPILYGIILKIKKYVNSKC